MTPATPGWPADPVSPDPVGPDPVSPNPVSPNPVSLDDLLSEEADDQRPARRRPAWWLVRAILGSAVLAVALVVVLRVVGYDLPFPATAAGVFALLCLHRLVTGLPAAPAGPVGGRPRGDSERPVPDEFDTAVHRWQTEISWGRAGIRPFTRTATVLGDLVDERLRLRHRLTLASDPARARTLVGERLWSYLKDPDAPTPSPRDLAALLTDVEKL